ncbi:MAG: hypothetical protein WCH01_10485 [Methylococcaceae bacterium]
MFVLSEKSYPCLLLYPVARLVFLTINIFLLSGCAIDNFGLVKVQHFENETVYIVSKEAWGAYLSSNEADARIMFGHMNRILLYPKNPSSSELPLDNLLTNLQQDHFIRTKNINMDAFNTRSPIAWITNNQGLIFNANQFRFGITLGLESRDAIRLPKDFEGVFAFKYSSNGKIQAYFYQQSSHD